MAARSISLLLLTLLGAACVEPVSLGGERCPCATGYECCAATNLCQAVGTSCSLADAAGALSVDAAVDVPPGSPGAEAGIPDAPGAPDGEPAEAGTNLGSDGGARPVPPSPTNPFGPGDGQGRTITGIAGEFRAPGAELLAEGEPAIHHGREFRTDFFAVGKDHQLWNVAFVDQNTVPFPPIKEADVRAAGGVRDGVDVASWKGTRWDAVVRVADGNLMYLAFDLPSYSTEGWRSDRMMFQPGLYRPAIVQVGDAQRHRVVIFQVSSEPRRVVFRAGPTPQWENWKGRTHIELSAGIGALAVRGADGKARVYLASRNKENHAVLAVFDPDALELSDWVELGGDPEGGILGTPALSTFGRAPGQVDVFVVAADRSLWKRSYNSPRIDPAFVPVLGPKADKEYGAIDVAAANWSGNERADIARVNATTGRLEVGSLSISQR